MDKFIADLGNNPVSYIASNRAHVITNYDVLEAIVGPIYSPIDYFPKLAVTLAAAITGNFTPLVEGLHLPGPEHNCPLPGGQALSEYTWSGDAMSAIACGDGDDITSETPASYAEYAARLLKDSPTLGNSWGDIRLSCVGWRVRPKWRYTGPFGASGPTGKAGGEKSTAAPLLFTSSRLDPVTPLRHAFAMSKLFPGSSVVIQESVGHCAVSAPSMCTKKIIEKYFETGMCSASGRSENVEPTLC